MRSFEIFVAPEPGTRDSIDDGAAVAQSGTVQSVGASHADGAAYTAGQTRRHEARRRDGAREVIDVFIEGANVTARIADKNAACVLRDLGFALAELGQCERGKAIVRFYDEPWEMCVERLGAVASLSVYRAGNDPKVAVYDRCVPLVEVFESAREALDGLIERAASGATTPALLVELRAARQAIASIELSSSDAPGIPGPTPVAIEIERDAPISFAAEFSLRDSGRETLAQPGLGVERADVHALLFRGRIRAEVRARAVELGDGHPFLFAERLVDGARRALAAWEHGQPLHVRSEAGGVVIGVRVAADGAAALTLGAARGAPDRATCTFPALGVADFVEAALSFGRALVRAILRRDRSQSANLRLSAFRRQLRETSDVLRDVCQKDAKVNPSPELYRAFAKTTSALDSRARTSHAPTGPLPHTRLRYSPRWRAIVPGIDLRATFLCGDRLVIGGANETFCLDRSTGQVRWRVETERATSVVTPGGIARLHPDGALCIHDFGTGEITLRSWLAPRLGAPPAGAVVHVAGLPRLLILTEGEHHLVAVDLTSGEPRWRYAWGRRGALRLQRAGKLLYFTSGDSALTALDVATGAVVWRVRDRLRFRTSPTLDHDTMFAVAGGAGSATNLHAIDPFSGQPRWTRPVVMGPTGTCTVEGGALAAGSVVACAVRERIGLKLVAFERETGEPRWVTPSYVAPSGTSWLAVDDLFIGNTPSGELVAIEAETGMTRYRHVLGTVIDVDVPRRLEPVLRSGALYVPHSDVHVLRPSDGAELAVIGPCEAIPDLLRVDERCDVYVAEESGHVVSFGVGARLSLVR